jgi:hypothetical protein
MPLDPDALTPAPRLPSGGAAGDRGPVRFRAERDLGGVLSATFAFLRAVWRELGWALLLIAGPVLLLTAVAQFFLQTQVFGALGGLLGQPGGPPPDPEAMQEEMMGAVFGPSYVVSLVGAMIAAALVTALVLGYVRLYRAGAAGAVTPGVLWAEASHHLGAVLALAGGAVLLAMGAGLLSMGGCLGTLVWVGLALYVLPLVGLALAARVTAGRPLGEALAEAQALLGRSWGSTFVVALVAGLIQYAFTLVLSLPTGVAVAMTMMHAPGTADGSSETMRVLMAVGSLLGTFGQLLYAIPLVALTLQYYNLREQEEGGGLSARVDALGGAPAPTPPPLPPPGAEPGDEEAATGGPPRPGFRGRGFDEEA